MRLIPVEQSDVFQISHRLIAGEVCANSLQGRDKRSYLPGKAG